jgi:hypothetical protein
MSSSPVLDLFFRLLVSVSVDCGVELCGAFMLEAKDERGVLNALSDAFPVAIPISLSMLYFQVGRERVAVKCAEFKDAWQNIRFS